MKKMLALFLLTIVATPALAHNLVRHPEHMNPHWLPGTLFVGAILVFAVAIVLSTRKKD